MRRETARVLELDYLRTARGKRLSPFRLYTRHALPNILASVLTVTGLILSTMLGGAIIMEIVFNWPGLGTAIVSAILTKDYPVIQGIVLVLGLIATLINLLVDIILVLVNPRVLGGKEAVDANG